MQTQNFNRIRIGIGSPPLIKEKNNFNTISHVLGNISLEEKSILDKVYKRQDKDLPLGKIRFRKKGSSGGHNGLKSIIEQLQTQNFNRIRIGIGSPPPINGKNNFNTISHVLGTISQEEKSILDKVYKQVIESIEQLNTKREQLIINELNSFDKDRI